MEAIVNTSTSGDSLKNSSSTVLAKEQGFGHVNKIWYDKTLSYEQGKEQLIKERESRRDIKCPAKDMVPYYDEELNEIGFEDADGKRYDFTEHALCQYGTRTNICHTYIKQNLSPIMGQNGKIKRQHDAGDIETLYRVLKNGHRHMSKNVNYLWRTYTDKDGNSIIRACLTEDYTPIDNVWYLETLESIIPGGRLSHFNFSDADTLYGNVLIPDSIRKESDSDYGGMVSMSNCEIGTRVNASTPGTFRYICFNGCIWGLKKGESHTQVHRGRIDFTQLAKGIRECIEAQIPLIQKRVDSLLSTKLWKVEAGVTVPQIMTSLFDGIGIRGKARVEQVFTEYNKNTAKEQTAFDIIDAITRASQTFDAKAWVSTDAAIASLISGGKNRWDRLNATAREVTKEDLARIMKSGNALAV